MRRALAVLLGVAAVAGGLVLLAAAFADRDDAGVGTPAGAGPGRLQADRGAAHAGRAAPLAPGELRTSGPHEPALVARDRRALSADQLLHALELGNVVLAYGGARPPQELARLQRAVAGPFDAELALAGQAVVLARVPALTGFAALAWRRVERTAVPGDQRLRAFAEHWLGQGASAAR